MTDAFVTAFCLVTTVAAYLLSRYCARVRSPFTTPVFLSTALSIAALWTAGLGAQDYQSAKAILTALLPAATVALAVPLYKNRALLKGRFLAAAAGIVTGSLVTVVSGLLLMRALGLPEAMFGALLVKSVTAPIAVELAAGIGADPALAAGFVIATGMIGAMLGPVLLNAFRVEDPIARAVSIGTVSHGQGAAQMVEEGQVQGAVAGVAMGIAAILSTALVPMIAALLR
ncbi:MAG TPA: LrgB family protein [Burkholderiales bacterium]|jgi:putative effector of murein hydrolase